MHTPFVTRRQVTAGATSTRLRGLRALTLPLVGLVIAAAMSIAPALASADSGSQLTVVGTSDVSDSGLIQNVIAPDFKAQFPQYAFKYVPSATGAAIQTAESGNGGPSALIVHAASLENQFVAGGYSYQNQYGNAIFTNDFVLAGPVGDPAGVGTNAANNIAQAFADVAAAGAAGNATFISRGGTTTASGTTVEEHTIWALVQSAGLTPTGVYLCSVSAADGGGASPTTAAHSGQACPDSGTVTSADAPAWYAINSMANQGANVVATNACTVGTTAFTANTCYSLTDRGTFAFLAGGNSPAAGTTGIPNLKIETQNNSASAPGGANELVNYFHVYIINPSAPGETVNLPAAQDFVSMLTSPSFQAALPNYLNTVSPTPVFNGTASPSLTASWSTTSVAAGATVTVSGQLTNKEPGYPALANQKVSVNELVGLASVPVTSATTNATGAYSVTFAPAAAGSYDVSTGSISQIENATLSPPYGDTLAPASTAAQTLSVGGSVDILKATTSQGAIQASGQVKPATPDANATITLLARPRTSKGGFSPINSKPLARGATTYAIAGPQRGGNWTIEVQYADPGSLTTATSATSNVTVPNNAVTVKFKRVSIARGRATVSGTLNQAPQGSSATVKLYALTVSSKNGKFRQAAKATVKTGKTTFTITHKFTRGTKLVLQLQYTHRGQTATYSGYQDVTVR